MRCNDLTRGGGLIVIRRRRSSASSHSTCGHGCGSLCDELARSFHGFLGKVSMRSWVIGSSLDCDVVVDSPLASGRHCQLTQTADGFLLNDLGSTNGTFVNGVRLAGSTRLRTADSITLGRTVPFPWPRGCPRGGLSRGCSCSRRKSIPRPRSPTVRTRSSTPTSSRNTFQPIRSEWAPWPMQWPWARW
jgi:hypothetical protein